MLFIKMSLLISYHFKKLRRINWPSRIFAFELVAYSIIHVQGTKKDRMQFLSVDNAYFSADAQPGLQILNWL